MTDKNDNNPVCGAMGAKHWTPELKVCKHCGKEIELVWRQKDRFLTCGIDWYNDAEPEEKK